MRNRSDRLHKPLFEGVAMKRMIFPQGKDDLVNAMTIAAGSNREALRLADFYQREAQFYETWECAYVPPMYSRERFEYEQSQRSVFQDIPANPNWMVDSELQEYLVAIAEDYEHYCELLADIRRQTRELTLVKFRKPSDLPPTALTTSIIPTRWLEHFKLRDNLVHFQRFFEDSKSVPSSQVMCFSKLQANQFWLGVEAIRSAYFARKMLKDCGHPLDLSAMVEAQDLASELLNEVMGGALHETLNEVPVQEMSPEELHNMDLVIEKVLDQEITNIFGATINPVENRVRKNYLQWEIKGRRNPDKKRKLLLLSNLFQSEEQQN